MRRQKNVPLIQFCVEVRTLPDCQIVDRFTIEQSPGRNWSKTRACALYNQVQEHLNHLSMRNGLAYEIVLWGKPEDRSDWKNGYPIEGKYGQLSLLDEDA